MTTLNNNCFNSRDANDARIRTNGCGVRNVKWSVYILVGQKGNIEGLVLCLSLISSKSNFSVHYSRSTLQEHTNDYHGSYLANLCFVILNVLISLHTTINSH